MSAATLYIKYYVDCDVLYQNVMQPKVLNAVLCTKHASNMASDAKAHFNCDVFT